MPLDVLTRQQKGSELTHDEMDGNLLAIKEAVNSKLDGQGHAGAGGNAHALATTESDGFMSKDDKAKLNGLPDAAADVGDALPLGAGSASAGVSESASREDHRHPATSPTQATSDSSNNNATTAFVHAVVQEVVGIAPEALNQIAEVAASLGNNPDFIGYVQGELGKREHKSNVIRSTGTAAP